MTNKKSTIFISIVGVALFIVVIVAASYAYYTATTSTTGDKNPTSVSTTKISVKFSEETPNVSKSNMFPGDSLTKTFTLENTGTKAISYEIVINNVKNTFTKKSDVQFTLKQNGVETPINSGQFPGSGETPEASATLSGKKLTINPGAKITYTLVIQYLNTSEDQAGDMGKTISGEVFIKEV